MVGNLLTPELATEFGAGRDASFGRSSTIFGCSVGTLLGGATFGSVFGSGFSAVKSWDLETRNYDDEAHPYLYAHTQRSFIPLVRLIYEKAAKIKGTETGIAIFAPENWPLAWPQEGPNGAYRRPGH